MAVHEEGFIWRQILGSRKFCQPTCLSSLSFKFDRTLRWSLEVLGYTFKVSMVLLKRKFHRDFSSETDLNLFPSSSFHEVRKKLLWCFMTIKMLGDNEKLIVLDFGLGKYYGHFSLSVKIRNWIKWIFWGRASISLKFSFSDPVRIIDIRIKKCQFPDPRSIVLINLIKNEAWKYSFSWTYGI